MTVVTKVYDWLSDKGWWTSFMDLAGSVHLRLKGFPLFPIDYGFFHIFDEIHESEYEAEKNGKSYIYGFVSVNNSSLLGSVIRGVSSLGGKKSLYTHAGLIPEYKDLRSLNVMHMMGSGLLYHNILSLLKEVDYFSVVRYEVTKEEKCEIGEYIKSILKDRDNFDYDYAQALGNGKDVYCSELIYMVLKGKKRGYKTVNIWGREAFTPDLAYKSGEIIYTNYV